MGNQPNRNKKQKNLWYKEPVVIVGIITAVASIIVAVIAHSKPEATLLTHGDNSPAVHTGNNSPVTFNNLVTKEAKEEELKQATLSENYKLSVKYPYGYALLANAQGATVHYTKFKDYEILGDWTKLEFKLNVENKTISIFLPNLVFVNHKEKFSFASRGNTIATPYILNKSEVLPFPQFRDILINFEVIDEELGILLIGFK